MNHDKITHAGLCALLGADPSPCRGLLVVLPSYLMPLWPAPEGRLNPVLVPVYGYLCTECRRVLETTGIYTLWSYPAATACFPRRRRRESS